MKSFKIIIMNCYFKNSLKLLICGLLFSSIVSCDEETNDELRGPDSKPCLALDSVELTDAKVSYLSRGEAFVEIDAIFSEENSASNIDKFEWTINGVNVEEFEKENSDKVKNATSFNHFKYQFSNDGSYEICVTVSNLCEDKVANKCTIVVIEIPEPPTLPEPGIVDCDTFKDTTVFSLLLQAPEPFDKLIQKVDEDTYTYELVSGSLNWLVVIPPFDLISNNWSWTLDKTDFSDPERGTFLAGGFGYSFVASFNKESPTGIGTHQICLQVEAPNCELKLEKCITLIVKDEFTGENIE